MKIRTRIVATLSAVVASLFVAAPAFAHDGHEHNPYSSAGQPVDIVAITIVMLVLLAVVLIGSTVVGNLFEKNKK